MKFKEHCISVTTKKNKLYKNVKQKIGEYVGRYDPDKEIIHTDITDSDDEE
jgi:hypothetical protein